MLNVNRVMAAGVALAVWLAAALPSGALAASSADAAATAAFLHSEQRTIVRETRLAPKIAADANAFVTRLARACPKGLSSAPANPSSGQKKVIQAVMAETLYDFVLAGAVPADRVERADAAAISRLHWSDARLNADVAAYARSELSVRPPGDPCPDMKATTADRFRVMPPGAEQFIALSHARKVASLGTLLRLMSPLASPAERSGISQLRKLNRTFERRLEVGLMGPTLELLFLELGGSGALSGNAGAQAAALPAWIG